MSNMNPLNPYGGNTPKIEQMIGSAYDNVRKVAQNIDTIKAVSLNKENIDKAALISDSVLTLEEEMIQAVEVTTTKAQEATDSSVIASTKANETVLSAQKAKVARDEAVQASTAANSLVGSVSKAVLSYPDYAAASAAATTLPDGQVVEIESDETREGRRTVNVRQGEAILFVDYLPSAIKLQSYTSLDNYTGKADAVDIMQPGITGRWYRRGNAAANVGTVRKDAAGRSWERTDTWPVLADWFKQAGEVDDTLALQRAAAYIDATGGKLRLLARTYSISGPVIFNKPPTIEGDEYSPPIIGKFQGVPYPVKGTVILCDTGDQFAIQINPTAWYHRGVNLINFHVLGVPGKAATYGLLIKNCGWGGYVRGVVVERFRRIGLNLSQVQDTLFDQIEVLDCGLDNESPAVFISDYSNLLTFIRPRFELNEYQMLIAGGFGFEFHGAHFEQGDYPGTEEEVGDLLRISRYPSIRLQATGVVKFFGGAITGCSAARQMTKFGISIAELEHHILVAGDCADVSFIGTTMGAPYNNGLILNFYGAGRVHDCEFQNLLPNRAGAEFNNVNASVRGNTFRIADPGTTDTLYGIATSAGAQVEGNTFICANAASVNKTAGTVIAGAGKIGRNAYHIDKVNMYVDNGESSDTAISGGVSVDLTGSVDLRKFRPNATLINTTAGALSALAGMFGWSEVRILNQASGTLTIPHGGNISCAGSVNAVIPAGGIIHFLSNPVTGVFTELWRRF